MFVAAGLWAIVGVAATSWGTGLGPERPLLETVAAWHAHEMLFGFVAAAFAGYTLTAMTSWAGPAGLSRRNVALLVALWVVARLAASGALGGEPRLVVPAAVAFLAWVTVLLAAAAWRSGMPRGAVQALFAMLLSALQIAVLTGMSLPRFPVLGLALLLSVVGARIIAAFTWNRIDRRPAQARRFGAARLAGVPGAVAIAVVLVLDALGPGHERPVPALLLLAATTETMRLALWQSREVWRDRLLGMLHLGYCWLPLGLALVALARWPAGRLREGDALHAVAAGAVACAIYAVAARALARRADRLRPAFVDTAGFVLLWLAAALRVFAPADTAWSAAAPVLWCAAWALFLMRHGAALFRPVPRPVFSGPKRQPDCPDRPDG